MAKLYSFRKCCFNSPVVSILCILWVYVFIGTSAVDPPQSFSLEEEGSTEVNEYSCNSYIKQFNSIDEVSYTSKGILADNCLCSLTVSSASNIDDEDSVLSIQFQSRVTPVKYEWFKTCAMTLSFIVEASVSQTVLKVDCADFLYVNDLNRDNPVVMTKSSGFSGSISMSCESENEITTPEPTSTTPVTDTTPSSNAPKEGPLAGDGSDGSNKSGLSGGEIAGIVIGVLLGIGIIAAVVVVFVWRWKKKKNEQTQPDPPEMTHKDTGVANVYNNMVYTNDSQNNNFKRSNSSLEDTRVNYANLDPSSLKSVERPVRTPSSPSPTLNYVEIDWKKQSVI